MQNGMKMSEKSSASDPDPAAPVAARMIRSGQESPTLSEAQIDGLAVHARRLADGRLNLAALPTDESHSETSLEILVAHLVAVADVRVDATSAEGQAWALKVRLDGKLALTKAGTDALLAELSVVTTEPMATTVSATGAVHVRSSGTTAELSVTARSDGAERNGSSDSCCSAARPSNWPCGGSVSCSENHGTGICDVGSAAAVCCC